MRDRHQADAEQDDLLPSREPDEEARPEEEPERREADQPAQAERAGLDLEHEAEDAERKQQRGDERVGEEPDDQLRPVRLERHDARVRQADRAEQLGLACHGRLRVAHPQRLVGAQRQELVRRVETGHLHPLVHHRFGHARIEPARLGQRAELAAHGGDHLLRRLHPLAVHGRGRAEHGARPHVDRLGGQGDEGAGTVGTGIDEGVDGDRGRAYRVRDPLGGIDAAAWRVDVEIDGGGARRGGLTQAPGDVGSEAVLDHAGDGQAVHGG